MPRKPTGKPTGRPPGSGVLGEVKPLTVRLPTPLYQKLELFAEGRAFHRGVPELSGCVRELLEYALAGMSTRQTVRTPAYSNGQTESDSLQKTENGTAGEGEEIQQTGSDSLQKTVSVPPVSLDAKDLEEMPLVPVAMPPRGVAVWDRASVLAQLDAWKAEGLSLQTMADRLNTSAVPTFSGKGTWKKGTIGNLLAHRQAPPVA